MSKREDPPKNSWAYQEIWQEGYQQGLQEAAQHRSLHLCSGSVSC